MSKTTIAYFEARARIEPIRVLLEEMAIPYEDQRISFEAWAPDEEQHAVRRAPLHSRARSLSA